VHLVGFTIEDDLEDFTFNLCHVDFKRGIRYKPNNVIII